MLGRLVLVSILVGVVLTGARARSVEYSSKAWERLIRTIWNMGFDAVKWLWRYFLLGAVIVIPIWLVMRLVNAPRGK